MVFFLYDFYFIFFYFSDGLCMKKVWRKNTLTTSYCGIVMLKQMFLFTSLHFLLVTVKFWVLYSVLQFWTVLDTSLHLVSVEYTGTLMFLNTRNSMKNTLRTLLFFCTFMILLFQELTASPKKASEPLKNCTVKESYIGWAVRDLLVGTYKYILVLW